MKQSRYEINSDGWVEFFGDNPEKKKKRLRLKRIEKLKKLNL